MAQGWSSLQPAQEYPHIHTYMLEINEKHEKGAAAAGLCPPEACPSTGLTC